MAADGAHRTGIDAGRGEQFQRCVGEAIGDGGVQPRQFAQAQGGVAACQLQ